MKNFVIYSVIGIFMMSMISCSDDDEPIGTTGRTENFALFEVDDSNVQGTVHFNEREDGAVIIEVLLEGTQSGVSHPININHNSAAVGGMVAISLNPIDGSTGSSETVITELDNGSSISFDEIIAFDGHLNVYQSQSNQTLIAQGDIGPNELTGEAEFYRLSHVGDTDNEKNTIVSFKERVDGTTLVEIDFDGTTTNHPVILYHGTVDTGNGEEAIVLNNINENGMSVQDVAELDNGSSITYDELINFDGSIVIYESSTNDVLAAGDIGANEFTGNFESYDLNEVDGSGISGIITFYQRQDNTFLSAVQLDGTVVGSSHPIRIHHGNMSEVGNIAISLDNVEGGLSITEVDNLDNGTAISYDEILNYDGHINVHPSDDELSTYVARGNIGANE